MTAMPIYLDNQATTPTDPRVVAAMLPYFTTWFANPHSADHAAGRDVAAAVDTARAQVAALIGAEPREIVITSGATESNNLAIKGAARFANRGATRGGGRHHQTQLVTLQTEHKCVLESVRDMAAEGFTPVILPVRPDGRADLDALAAALQTPTLLVSIMAVNNETGVMQDLAAISALVHAHGALFHADLAQAAGKIPIDVSALGLDLASISAHKLYGPKGIGALYVRRRPRVRLAPLFSGGGQERGLRSGTIPAPLAVGLGEACRIAGAEMGQEFARISLLRARLISGLRAHIPGVVETVPGGAGLPGAVSLRIPGLSATALLAACPRLHASTGSACTSADVAPSHVLVAMGLSPSDAASTLRLGIGRFTSAAEIDETVTLLAHAAASLATARRPISAEA